MAFHNDSFFCFPSFLSFLNIPKHQHLFLIDIQVVPNVPISWTPSFVLVGTLDSLYMPILAKRIIISSQLQQQPCSHGHSSGIQSCIHASAQMLLNQNVSLLATQRSHSVIPSLTQQSYNYISQNDKHFCVLHITTNKNSFIKLTLNQYSHYNVATIHALCITPLRISECQCHIQPCFRVSLASLLPAEFYCIPELGIFSHYPSPALYGQFLILILNLDPSEDMKNIWHE